MSDREPTLIVLRGPSGSGKSSVARLVRNTWKNPIALLEQDYLRRIVLQEKDTTGGINIELIKRTALFCLKNSFDVIMEGIFDTERYNRIFEALLQAHPENNHFFYFDTSIEETLRRHQHKHNRNEFGETEMRQWYKSRDLLPCTKEILIPETNSQQDTVDLIISSYQSTQEFS